MSEPTKPLLTVNTGPFKNLAFPGHASADDYDKEAGKAGTCVEDADTNVLYRSTLPEFHEKFTPTLETLSGQKRGVNADATEKAKAKSKTPDKVKDVPESFVDFANKVKASVSEDIWKEIETQAKAVALTVPIDASPSSRGGGIAKAYREKAAEVLARAQDAYDASVAKLQAAVSDFVLDTDPETGRATEDSLARLVAEFYRTQI